MRLSEPIQGAWGQKWQIFAALDLRFFTHAKRVPAVQRDAQIRGENVREPSVEPPRLSVSLMFSPRIDDCLLTLNNGGPGAQGEDTGKVFNINIKCGVPLREL
jgi:hypothetical protein